MTDADLSCTYGSWACRSPKPAGSSVSRLPPTCRIFWLDSSGGSDLYCDFASSSSSRNALAPERIAWADRERRRDPRRVPHSAGHQIATTRRERARACIVVVATTHFRRGLVIRSRWKLAIAIPRALCWERISRLDPSDAGQLSL